MALQTAHVAGKQNKFCKYTALLYQNPNSLMPQYLAQYAAQVGIEAEAISICVNCNRYHEEIRQDMHAAQMERITGTPTFVIGRRTDDVITGKRIVGAQGYNVFSGEIDRLLKVVP